MPSKQPHKINAVSCRLTVAMGRLRAVPKSHPIERLAQSPRKGDWCFTLSAQGCGFLFLPLTKSLFALLPRIGNGQCQLGREGSIARSAYQRTDIPDWILDLATLHTACERVQDLLGRVLGQHDELTVHGGALGFGEPWRKNQV
jgi:hypothetical protein